MSDAFMRTCGQVEPTPRVAWEAGQSSENQSPSRSRSLWKTPSTLHPGGSSVDKGFQAQPATSVASEMLGDHQEPTHPYATKSYERPTSRLS